MHATAELRRNIIYSNDLRKTKKILSVDKSFFEVTINFQHWGLVLSVVFSHVNVINYRKRNKRNMRSANDLRWRFLRFVIAAIILTAAIMKAWQLATTPSLGEGLLNARWFNILVVEFELFFGVWLIFGMLPKLTWLATVGCFSVFALVSFYKALSGEASCGCFGAATINPWYTMVFDLSIIGALIKYRPIGIILRWDGFFSEFFEVQNRKAWMAVVWMLVAVPASCAMASVKNIELAELGTEFVGADGRKTILLEPEKWIGKRFPLWENVDDGSKSLLNQGEWMILIGRKHCDECRRLAENVAARSRVPLAVLDVDDDGTSFDFMHFKQVSVRGTMQMEPYWIILTPTLIACQDGVCVGVGENSIMN